jgi:hypothetical protein
MLIVFSVSLTRSLTLAVLIFTSKAQAARVHHARAA